MDSRIAREARDAQRAATARLTPDELLDHMSALWEEAVRARAAFDGVSLAEARRRLELARQAGRTPSACALALANARR